MDLPDRATTNGNKDETSLPCPKEALPAPTDHTLPFLSRTLGAFKTVLNINIEMFHAHSTKYWGLKHFKCFRRIIQRFDLLITKG